MRGVASPLDTAAMSDDKQPVDTELDDATRYASASDLAPALPVDGEQPPLAATPTIPGLGPDDTSDLAPALLVDGEQPPLAALGMLPASQGNDPPPLPVIEAPLTPVHHHRVGGNARHRVKIDGHAGETAVVRVGRHNPGVDVPRITLPGDVLEDIALALVEGDCQRALQLLAPHYAPGDGIVDAPRKVDEPEATQVNAPTTSVRK